MAEDSDDNRLPRATADTDPQTRAMMECTACGAMFPRSDVAVLTKGTLACPECGSREIGDI